MRLIFFLLLFPCALLGAHQRESFEKGLLFYYQNKIEDALTSFLQLTPGSTCALANAGTCYDELNKKPEAMACWLGAQQRGSFLESRYAAQKLDRLREQVGVEVSVPWYQKVWGWCPLLLVVVQLSFLASWFGTLWQIRQKKGVLALLPLGFVLVLTTFFLGTAFATQQLKRAVVTSKVPVYIGPCTEYHTKGMLNELDVVSIYDQKERWYKITYNNGYGWIPAQDLILV